MSSSQDFIDIAGQKQWLSIYGEMATETEAEIERLRLELNEAKATYIADQDPDHRQQCLDRIRSLRARKSRLRIKLSLLAER